MADEKVNMGPEENKPPETLSPPGQGDLPPLEENNAPAVSGEDKAAPDHVELDPPSADKHTQQTVLPGMGEDTPAPAGKVINLSELQSADNGKKEVPAPAGEEKAPEADQPKKRRGRPPKEQAGVSAGKKEKAAEPRTGRPSKVDKAAREEAPPSVRDKVSRGKKADKGKETGSGGAPVSKSAKAVKPGKAAPVKEAAVPPPEINLPPTPDVPPRPVEEGKIVYLKMAELHPFHTFREHPYKVQDNEEMDALAESIKAHGVVSPIIVRPLENTADEYEIISGHRRVMASRKAGITEVPALVVSLDRNAAAIVLVDSNLHREHILPSEKAFAYKMKAEALEHQGWKSDLTSCQVGTKLRTDEQIAADANDSARQVQRYIRLTNLIPEILQYVDEGRISFTPAVELSYLNEQEQYDLLEQMELNDCTPSLSQACRFKKMSQEDGLTPESIAEIMSEEKANQREMFKVPMERIRQYVPNANAKQAEDFVLKACEHYRKFLIRQRNRDER